MRDRSPLRPVFLAVRDHFEDPLASPQRGMMAVDCGTVFSAMRRMRPSARMKIMSSGMKVFFIHIEISARGEVEQHAAAVRQFLAVHQPGAFSSSVVATSTKTLEPDG